MAVEPGADLEVARAEHLLALGRFVEAEARARSILTQDPEDPAAMRVLATAVTDQGRYHDALPLARRLVTAVPDAAAGYLLLSEVYSGLGDCEMALAVARQALRVDPMDPGSHYAVADRLSTMSHTEDGEALQHAERAVALAPHVPDAHNLVGMILLASDRLDEAEAAFRRALAIDPGYAPAHVNLAGVDLGRGRFAAAAAGVRRRVQADPRRVPEGGWAAAFLRSVLARLLALSLASLLVLAAVATLGAPAWARALLCGVIVLGLVSWALPIMRALGTSGRRAFVRAGMTAWFERALAVVCVVSLTLVIYLGAAPGSALWLPWR